MMVTITGLDPDVFYDLLFVIASTDQYRYKYANMKWQTVGESEVHQNEEKQKFKHPNGPNTGEYWMQKPISFRGVKISNYDTSKNGNVSIYLTRQNKDMTYCMQ